MMPNYFNVYPEYGNLFGSGIYERPKLEFSEDSLEDIKEQIILNLKNTESTIAFSNIIKLYLYKS